MNGNMPEKTVLGGASLVAHSGTKLKFVGVPYRCAARRMQ